jgi:Xaa-Pro aminopeptidase
VSAAPHHGSSGGPAPEPSLTALTEQLRGRVLSAFGDAEFDWLVVAQPENVGYLTGYRSLSETMKREPTMVVAIDRSGELHLVGPAADAGVVLHDGVVADERYIPYGRFYFESTEHAAASRMADVHPSLPEAAAALVARLGPEATVGADAAAAAALAGQIDTERVVDASGWMSERRACKTPAEVGRLERAARLTENAIESAIELIVPGVTEVELARHIAAAIGAGGGTPRFVVVTSGERSALADAVATERAMAAGDLVRFDIGCILDGYWADLGRTAVLGRPSALQSARYDAILAGEQAQLDMARPGVTAAQLFGVAVTAVRARGLVPYRRHHCGHGIGSEVYERPIIAPGWDVELREGMTFCFETPFYELGWGGMMVEDTVVITRDGCRPLNVSDRSLRVR